MGGERAMSVREKEKPSAFRIRVGHWTILYIPTGTYIHTYVNINIHLIIPQQHRTYKYILGVLAQGTYIPQSIRTNGMELRPGRVYI